MTRKDRRLLARHWPELNKRNTELGREKRCPRCNEWLPHDGEFYSFISTRGHYHSHCKACQAEQKQLRKAG